jgi:nucleotidyltransferase substrate binding protein (TIGR01987 family)
MKDETKIAIKKLSDAITTLECGVLEAKSELEKDGVIQRFEFTFELLWKAYKVILFEKGVKAKTPKDSLQEAFRVGYIEDEQAVLNMLDDRNLTSHIYSKKESEKIFQNIKQGHLPSLKKMLAQIKQI